MMRERETVKRPNSRGWVGNALKGATAGAVRVWLMGQGGSLLYRCEDPAALQREQAARVEGKDPAHVAADKMARALGVTLASSQPRPAGIAVHYALGAVPGALYGPLRRRVDGVGAGAGLLYGLGLFLVNDELLNPLIGLASGPTAYPWQAHARGLGRAPGPRDRHGYCPGRPGPDRLESRRNQPRLPIAMPR